MKPEVKAIKSFDHFQPFATEFSSKHERHGVLVARKSPGKGKDHPRHVWVLFGDCLPFVLHKVTDKSKSADWLFLEYQESDAENSRVYDFARLFGLSVGSFVGGFMGKDYTQRILKISRESWLEMIKVGLDEKTSELAKSELKTFAASRQSKWTPANVSLVTGLTENAVQLQSLSAFGANQSAFPATGQNPYQSNHADYGHNRPSTYIPTPTFSQQSFSNPGFVTQPLTPNLSSFHGTYTQPTIQSQDDFQHAIQLYGTHQHVARPFDGSQQNTYQQNTYQQGTYPQGTYQHNTHVLGAYQHGNYPQPTLHGMSAGFINYLAESRSLAQGFGGTQVGEPQVSLGFNDMASIDFSNVGGGQLPGFVESKELRDEDPNRDERDSDQDDGDSSQDGEEESEGEDVAAPQPPRKKRGHSLESSENDKGPVFEKTKEKAQRKPQ